MKIKGLAVKKPSLLHTHQIAHSGNYEAGGQQGNFKRSPESIKIKNIKNIYVITWPAEDEPAEADSKEPAVLSSP